MTSMHYSLSTAVLVTPAGVGSSFLARHRHGANRFLNEFLSNLNKTHIHVIVMSSSTKIRKVMLRKFSKWCEAQSIDLVVRYDRITHRVAM